MSKLVWQVVKYGVIGALATAINVVVAEACAAYVWPCLGPDDLLVRHFGLAPTALADATRALLAVWCNLAGFLVSNGICWYLNRLYVFTPGRHRWYVEYALFLSGSGFAILCGSAAIWSLVRFWGVQTTYSFAVNMVISVLVNFAVRKFLVFKE